MEQKRCGRCGVTKPLEEFHRWRRRDGRQPWCKPCRKAYHAEYWQRNRDRRIQQADERRRELGRWVSSLETGPCSDCGLTFGPEAMQWDHLPGATKSANVSDLVRQRVSRERIVAEMAKCQLVCANCHAARTLRRRNGA